MFASETMPRLCRMPDYAASSVVVALNARSWMRHNSRHPHRLCRKWSSRSPGRKRTCVLLIERVFARISSFMARFASR